MTPTSARLMSMSARASATGVWGLALGAIIVGVIALMAGFDWGWWIVGIGVVFGLLAIFTGTSGHGGI